VKRKVVKHGLSTFIVSLPLKWVKEYDIKKGDELDLAEEGSRLIISTEKSAQAGKIEVDITGLDRSSLMYLIRAIYKRGYDEIKLTFKKQNIHHYRLNEDHTVLSIIHEELNRLIGLEVMQQRENFCVIKSVSNISPSEFDSILRRAFSLLMDMSEDLINGMERNDADLLSTLEEKHNTITKLLSFCMRTLNMAGYKDYRKTTAIYSIIFSLDKVLDVLKNTGRSFIIFKPTVSAPTIKIMKKIHETLVEYGSLFYSYSNSKVMLISELRDTILKEVQKIYNQLSKKELVIINELFSIPEMLIAMTETRMQMEY